MASNGEKKIIFNFHIIPILPGSILAVDLECSKCLNREKVGWMLDPCSRLGMFEVLESWECSKYWNREKVGWMFLMGLNTFLFLHYLP